MKFQRYDNYKDSGVDWLGDIPEHWEAKKLKFIGNIYAGLNGKKGDDFSKQYEKEMKPFIPFTNIYNNLRISDTEFQFVRVKENENQNRVIKNDILFLMSSETLEDIGKCSIYQGEHSELYLNSFCKGFRINHKSTNPEYINYLLSAKSYRTYFSLVGRGFTRINIKQEFINSLLTLIPPIEEQTAIAEFLDRKAAQIDQAIVQKERQIELLQERRQILIHNAVTRGLNPNVKMKDSGVEWIGEIPEHWEFEPIKHSLHGIVDCEHKTAPFVDEEEFFVVRTSNVKEGKLSFNNAKYTNEKGFIEWTKRGIPKPGDIILTREAPAGEACIVPKNVKLCLGQRTVWLKINREKLLPEMAIYFIYSKIGRTYIDFLSAGSTVLHFNIADIKNIPSIAIPIEEQNMIVQHIEKQSAKVEKANSYEQNEIEKLKEYKAVLINSAVTGKIKVSD